EKRGTHMSRFIEVIDESRQKPLCLDAHFELSGRLAERLLAKDVHVETGFTWFRRVKAPATGRESDLEMDVSFISRHDVQGGEKALQVSLLAKALCPCSKAI